MKKVLCFEGEEHEFKKIRHQKTSAKKLKNLYPDYWDTVKSCSLAIMKEEFNKNKRFLLHCDNMKTRIQLEKIAANITRVAVSYYHQCAQIRAMGCV